jgi:hypothetical protein
VSIQILQQIFKTVNSRESVVLFPQMALERFIDSLMFGIYERMMFNPAEAVGEMKVADIESDEKGFSVVRLDFGDIDERDCSQRICRVPEGWFEKGKVAQVFVKRACWQIPFQGVAYAVVERPEGWLVAIRPSEPVYGQPVDMRDDVFRKMFISNFMSKSKAPAFYKRFIQEENF